MLITLLEIHGEFTLGCHWKWLLWYHPQGSMQSGWCGMCYWWHFRVPGLMAGLADIRAQGTQL
jgi:hypothetical protein